MRSAFIFGRKGRVSARALARFACALTLIPLAAALVWPGPIVGETPAAPERAMSASGEVAPVELPRSRSAPATLSVGFTSEALNRPGVPELTEIEIKISRNLSFQPAGLPRCAIADLYYPSARQTCARSFVGHGSVTSEVTLPGQVPVMIDGKLLAFYAFAKDQPHILAQVTSGAPLPLTYVIPFRIAKVRGAFGTRLVVPQMRRIKGRCAKGHPNCFAQPYTLKGVYSHISSLEMSLHRIFAHADKRDSFVSAQCPAPGRRPEATFPLTRTSLRYADGNALTAAVNHKCEVSAE
jgi:hypothetical protein